MAEEKQATGDSNIRGMGAKGGKLWIRGMWAVVVVDKVGATVVGQVSDPTRLKGGQKGAGR